MRIMSQELIACFDKNLNPVSSMARFEAYDTEDVYYGIANVYVVDAGGRLLCSKRSEKVSGNPGKWQTCFGGHVDPGESFLQTAIRELAEEAGIVALPDALYLVAEASSETYQAHYKNYAFFFLGSIGDLSFPDQEVSEARWMTMDVYSEELALHPEQWCNGCNKERQQIILNWLARK